MTYWVLFAADAMLSGALAYTVTINRRLHRESRRAVPTHSDPGPGTHPVLGAIEPESSGGAEPDEGARPDPRVVAEPIRAWKVAQVERFDDGSLRFQGAFGGPYHVEARAKCEAPSFLHLSNVPGVHQAPDENCTCGFYALKERPEPATGSALLEVELYGKVIPHELGYRAEKQRVLSVTVKPHCSAVDPNPEYEVSFSRGHYVAPTIKCWGAAKFTKDGKLLCAQHAMNSGGRFYEWTAEPVNCETEWRWA